MSNDLAIGSRVRLRQAHNWLSRYASLAESGRIGTITGFPHPGRADVEFDVVKHGATPIVGTFLCVDLIPCNTPKLVQWEIAL